MGWIVLGSLVALFAGTLFWRVWSGKRKPGYHALVEYWVYSDVQRLPPTAALMDAVVSKNPHNRPNQPSITAREGILFSDLRLHLAVAKRDKNPFAFRPDLFDENAEPNAEILERLSDSHSIATIRFASQVPLQDKRHLQFVTHLADTVARLTRGRLVFDTVCERFWTTEELAQELGRNNDAERANLHLRVAWKFEGEGHRALTLGLRKVGRTELATSLQEPDEEVLVLAVLSQVAEQIFRQPDTTWPVQARQHGDEFVVSPVGEWEGRQLVKIERRLSKD